MSRSTPVRLVVSVLQSYILKGIDFTDNKKNTKKRLAIKCGERKFSLLLKNKTSFFLVFLRIINLSNKKVEILKFI